MTVLEKLKRLAGTLLVLTVVACFIVASPILGVVLYIFVVALAISLLALMVGMAAGGEHMPFTLTIFVALAIIGVILLYFGVATGGWLLLLWIATIVSVVVALVVFAVSAGISLIP